MSTFVCVCVQETMGDSQRSPQSNHILDVQRSGIRARFGSSLHDFVSVIGPEFAGRLRSQTCIFPFPIKSNVFDWSKNMYFPFFYKNKCIPLVPNMYVPLLLNK